VYEGEMATVVSESASSGVTVKLAMSDFLGEDVTAEVPRVALGVWGEGGEGRRKDVGRRILDVPQTTDAKEKEIDKKGNQKPAFLSARARKAARAKAKKKF